MTERRPILTILLGVLLIAVLTPLSQFLTQGLINSDLETASPAGWAVGLVTSLTLVVAAVRLIARRQLLSKANLVILYCMLTIAVPMMNMGLVRALFAAIRAVQEHYVKNGINTYRTAYQAQTPDWFPVVPTLEGLAWNKADRLLRLLQDPKALASREATRRKISLAISAFAARQKQRSVPPDAVAKEAGVIRGEIEALGVDEIEALLKQAEAPAGIPNAFRDAVAALGLKPDLDRRLAAARQISATSADRLLTRLMPYDEQEASYAAPSLNVRTTRDRVRFSRDRRRLTPAERTDLDTRIRAVEKDFDELRRDVSALSRSDFTKILNRRKQLYLEAFARLQPSDLAAIRASFVFRSSTLEREELYGQNGRNGTPSQNLTGMDASVWTDTALQKSADQAGLWTNIRQVWQAIPWALWRQPLMHWSALITCIFLFLMCLAEWLRRKWVDRENLAFPVVELVDSVIRHDYAIETASDPTAPESRGRWFAPTFWIGAAIGLLIVSMEALGSYNITANTPTLSFDVSGRLFTSGIFREIANVWLVVSPIAVGLLFLVSLEISFSIFVIYGLYRIATAVVKLATGGIIDSGYTGWAGGMMFPFEMEQLLGACLCLALVVLWKTWHTAREQRDLLPPETGTYLPARLTTTGLILLPLAMGALIWNMGVRNVPLLLLIGGLSLCLAVAAARVRAETGLPTQHVTYEFTKIPIVLGMTGWLGARVYTLFLALAFLPVTLLFRLLPQQLENIELARRHRIRYRTIAIASLTAFLVAVGIGILSFLVMAYYTGAPVAGEGASGGIGQPFRAVFSYPIWVAHFLGEDGLVNFREVHWIRVGFIAIGAGVFGLLLILRNRIMRFPLHPMGYLLVLLSTYYTWVTPYAKSPGTPTEVSSSWLWGSALVAWLLKKLIVKYGGMNTYRKAKPIFIGLAIGAIFGVFAWNATHLTATIRGSNLGQGETPGDFVKRFMDRPAYSPKAY